MDKLTNQDVFDRAWRAFVMKVQREHDASFDRFPIKVRRGLTRLAAEWGLTVPEEDGR